MHTAALHSQAAAAATSSSSPPLPAMTRIPNARDGGDPLDTEDGFWSSGDQRSKDPIEVAAARGLLLVLLGNGRRLTSGLHHQSNRLSLEGNWRFRELDEDHGF
nr:uncharacterized protein LOC9270196 [Oryza sativa Japonica Group]